ncbi:MAG TPA: ATP-binding protein [Anaerolineales bacterium]|nr:ATP-binding protein [Anaerolineales bacterium]
MLVSRRWWVSIPFILALAALFLMVWSGILALTYPHDGILTFGPTGLISELDSFGREHNKLLDGDVIVSVNDVPFNEAVPFYANKKIGETVKFIILRDGERIPLTILLMAPPRGLILNELVPLLVALAFWGIGVGVLSFKPSDRTSNLFFLFCQATALLLASGLMSGIGPRWTSGLFNFLLWLIGPLTVHFHLYFPEAISLHRRRVMLYVLYGLAFLCGSPYLIWGTQAVLASSWSDRILAAVRLFLTGNLLLAVGLLFFAFSHTVSPGVRGKIRIVVLGGALSLLPVITLTILPDAALRQPILPYTFAFLFLSILPLTYGYAIIRHRLIEIERHVNRGATYILVYAILCGIYLVLYAILEKLVPPHLFDSLLINTLLVLILASVFSPLHQRMQRLVDKAFYGSWYDYRSAVTQITQGMEQIPELPQLARTVGERVVKTLQIEDACIFLRDLEGDFSVIEVAPQPKVGEQSRLAFSALPKNSLSYLLNIGAVGRTSLRKTLSEVMLSPEERQLLDSEQVYQWVPVIGHGQVLGLLALGAKLGGDIFSGEDMDILRIVARQMGPLIENIHLVTRLRQYATELEQRVEQRTAELHAAKERVEAVLSSVGDGVFVTDLEGEIITVNQAFEEQSGYQAVEMIGQSLFMMLDGQENQERTAEIRSALASKFSWSGELMAHRKNGREYDIQLTLAPVRNLLGEIMGYVGSQRDVTQYKELERLKDQFILEVSHELRTPVTNMGLFAELLERGRPDRKAEYLATLKTEINKLMKMIEDILDLSRLEVGKYKRSSFSPVNFNLLTDQVVAAHAPLAQVAGLDLTFEPAANLPKINGDQNQLARVITNLVSNAIRYTMSGSVCVSTFPADGGVWLEVKDTGIGIDADDFPHLFDRFYRGRKVSQSKIQGSGLGLAIVKEIVDLHDGRIAWESEVGKGSTFRVWLPE